MQFDLIKAKLSIFLLFGPFSGQKMSKIFRPLGSEIFTMKEHSLILIIGGIFIWLKNYLVLRMCRFVYILKTI